MVELYRWNAMRIPVESQSKDEGHRTKVDDVTREGRLRVRFKGSMRRRPLVRAEHCTLSSTRLVWRHTWLRSNLAPVKHTTPTL